MNPSAQLPLRDIHLPEPVSWWPPAPGWWLLLALAILVPLLVIWLRKRRRHPPLDRLAMHELQTIRAAYGRHHDSRRLVRELSILLRRTAMSYLPRERSASLTGRAWVEQLNQLSKQPAFDEHTADILATAPYSPGYSSEADQLLQQVERWIRGLPRRPAT